MAFGDPFNAGANHGHTDAGTATTSTSTPSFGTTSGNTMIVAVRSGSTGGTITSSVSENSGSSFASSTLADATHTVASGGLVTLFYYPSLTGAANGAVRVKVDQTGSTSLRYAWCEYTGAFSLTAQHSFTDNGPSHTFNSGNITTTVVTTLIAACIGGSNTAATAPFTGGTSNSLTWTVRDELDSSLKAVLGLLDFNGGGQASGTYAGIATFAGALTDNIGGEIYSFTPAGAAFIAPAATIIPPLQSVKRAGYW